MRYPALVAALALALAGAGTAAASGGDCGSCEPPKPEPAKVSLCHATGSASNPYVLIRVSENALKAHKRHGDVLPTNGKCPAPKPPPDPCAHPEPHPDPCDCASHKH